MRLLKLIFFTGAAALHAAQETPDANPWRLTIESARSSFIVGEPVPVRFEFKNVSGKPRRLKFPLSFEWGLLVYNAPEAGQGEQYFSAKHLKAAASQRRPPDPRWIEPGQSVNYTACVIYNVRKKALAFAEPGRYSISARFPYDEGMESNALSITIKEPDQDHQKALSFLQTHALLPYLDPDGRRLKADSEQAVKAQEFLKLYGAGLYAWPLRLVLRDAGFFAQLTTYPEKTIDFNKFPGPPNQPKEHPLFLKNTGKENLVIKKIDPPDPPFRFKEPQALPRTLRPGDMQEFMILFEPQSRGFFSSALKIHSNDMRSPAMLTVVAGP